MEFSGNMQVKDAILELAPVTVTTDSTLRFEHLLVGMVVSKKLWSFVV